MQYCVEEQCKCKSRDTKRGKRQYKKDVVLCTWIYKVDNNIKQTIHEYKKNKFYRFYT